MLLRIRGQASSTVYYEHKLRRADDDEDYKEAKDFLPSSLPLLVQSLTVALNGGRSRVAQNQLELLLELERAKQAPQLRTRSGRQDLIFALIGGMCGSALAALLLGGGDTTVTVAAILLAAITGAALAAAASAATRLGTLWG